MLNLRMYRIRAGLTQMELCNHTEISTSRLSLLERGLIGPTQAEREALCTVLNASSAVLFREIRRRHTGAVGLVAVGGK